MTTDTDLLARALTAEARATSAERDRDEAVRNLGLENRRAEAHAKTLDAIAEALGRYHAWDYGWQRADDATLIEAAKGLTAAESERAEALFERDEARRERDAALARVVEVERRVAYFSDLAMGQGLTIARTRADLSTTEAWLARALEEWERAEAERREVLQTLNDAPYMAEMAIFAEALGPFFDAWTDRDKARNFVTCSMQWRRDADWWTLTTQRVGGSTPFDRLGELTGQVAALTAERDAAQARAEKAEAEAAVMHEALKAWRVLGCFIGWPNPPTEADVSKVFQQGEAALATNAGAAMLARAEKAEAERDAATKRADAIATLARELAEKADAAEAIVDAAKALERVVSTPPYLTVTSDPFCVATLAVVDAVRAGADGMTATVDGLRAEVEKMRAEREASKAEAREVRGYHWSREAKLVEMQRHRDHWRAYAYGKREKPTDFLDGNMPGGEQTEAERLTAAPAPQTSGSGGCRFLFDAGDGPEPCVRTAHGDGLHIVGTDATGLCLVDMRAYEGVDAAAEGGSRG